MIDMELRDKALLAEFGAARAISLLAREIPEGETSI
jgi:hypothetical protein